MKRFRGGARSLPLTALAFAALIALTAGAQPAHGNGKALAMHHAWVRPTPPGTTITAMYGTVVNAGKGARRLLRIHCDLAAAVEIHQTVNKGGMMHMEPVRGGVPIPAGGEVHFQPGGYHIMMIGLKAPIKPGETVRATLFFDDGGQAVVTAMVPPPGETPAGHGGHKMEHGKMGGKEGGHTMPPKKK